MKIDGKLIAGKITERLKREKPFKKFLAGVLVGSNPASKSFLAQKNKAAEDVGIDLRIYEFSEDISSDDLRKEVLKISSHKTCGGVIVQLPLPGQINSQYVLNVVPSEKDVDVLGERTLGSFYTGRGKILPPAVGVVEEILKKFPIDLGNSTVAVIGVGRLVGKPISVWLAGKAKETIILDKGSDFELLTRADLVICGAGIADLIKVEMLKIGAGVIDFGYGKNGEGKTTGDLDIFTAENLSFYTPTPGGTGPILVAKILENFYKLNS